MVFAFSRLSGHRFRGGAAYDATQAEVFGCTGTRIARDVLAGYTGTPSDRRGGLVYPSPVFAPNQSWVKGCVGRPKDLETLDFFHPCVCTFTPVVSKPQLLRYRNYFAKIGSEFTRRRFSGLIKTLVPGG